MALTRREFVQRSAAGAAALTLGPQLIETASAATLTPAQLSALKSAVRGQVFSPGTKGYAAAKQVFNARYNKGILPPAVVRVRDAADVQAVVAWANTHDIPLVPRSGGNAYNGASTSSSGVVVDLGGLDGVALNGSGIATVGPGARNLDVYAALARRGAAIPSGSCPNVAVGGIATGGGMGLSGRALGLTLDRIVGIDVVTADGRRQTVDADTNPDLFWALRGGGGSFGLVTAFRLRAKTVKRAAWFRASLPASSRADALAAWDALVPKGPSALTAICTLTPTGGFLEGQYFGSEAAMLALIKPFSQLPGVKLRSGTMSWLPLQRYWAACAEGASNAQCIDIAPQAFDASSIYISKPLTSAARSAFVAAANGGATLVCDAYGGKIDDVAPSATAFVHRTVRFSVQIVSYTSIGTARTRVRAARKRLVPYGNGQAYQNYTDLDLASPLTAYYGSNLPRLRQIKAEVDPDDRFQITQGIRP
ncbi:MAG: FAD-dependent oxidoreductase [Solirubrobacteraceae bacterium]|nr:FAD-dependent oxidoreductase [Solirubrobacteraceae bacterium]